MGLGVNEAVPVLVVVAVCVCVPEKDAVLVADDVGAGEVGEFVGAAIDAGQGKIRRGVADRERA